MDLKTNMKVSVDVSSSIEMINSGAITELIRNLLDTAIHYYIGVDSITIKGKLEKIHI